MNTPSLSTIKALFARSRNLCAFPGCKAPIIENSGTVTAEICHICSSSPRGPRYNKNQTPEERSSAANLMLMCGRHHKIVDTEPQKYTAAILLNVKQKHEEQSLAKISPVVTKAAEELLSNYARIAVIGNHGNVAIGSPGVIQAESIIIKTMNKKLLVQAPVGSIGANRSKVAYCEYLIARYQDYQKSDKTGKSNFKYAAIHVALKRLYGAPWKLLDESQFATVVEFLQKRIDATIVGKINRAKHAPNYSSFDVWLTSKQY